MNSSSNQDIMATLEDWFNKLPPLPESGKQGLVTFIPWIALIFGVLGVIFGIGALGAVTVLSPLLFLGAGVAHAGGSLLATVVSLAGSVALLAAYPGVKAKKLSGWRLLFWSQAIWVVSSLLSLSLMGLVVDAIGFYLVFQIKSFYK